ncbi:MAG: hypothetical protein ACKPKO_62295, partial [Candidatus Fonsibacter sp.]
MHVLACTDQAGGGNQKATEESSYREQQGRNAVFERPLQCMLILIREPMYQALKLMQHSPYRVCIPAAFGVLASRLGVM